MSIYDNTDLKSSSSSSIKHIKKYKQFINFGSLVNEENKLVKYIQDI